MSDSRSESESESGGGGSGEEEFLGFDVAGKGKKSEVHPNRGVIFLGGIPHGFYEEQMRKFFSQFGEVTRVRLSRNRVTGHSKHYAFVEFESVDVAKIVAETMDGYLMFGRRMKCQVVEASHRHRDLFKGADETFHTKSWRNLAIEARKQPVTRADYDRKVQHGRRRDDRKRQRLKKQGIEYDFPAVSDRK